MPMQAKSHRFQPLSVCKRLEPEALSMELEAVKLRTITLDLKLHVHIIRRGGSHDEQKFNRICFGTVALTIFCFAPG